MNSTLNDWFLENPERQRLMAQEKLIVAVTEDIWKEMGRRKMTKAQIAASLGKSKAYVTQVLKGSRNMTLRTVSDIAHALGIDVGIRFQLRKGRSKSYER